LSGFLTIGKIMNKTLSQLEIEYADFIELVASLDPSDEESLAEADRIFAEEIAPVLEQKLDGYIYWIRKLVQNAEACEQDAKHYANLAQTKRSQINWLKSRLFDFLERNELSSGKHKIRGDRHQAWLQNNATPPSPWIDPELELEDLDEEYIIPAHTIEIPAQVDYTKLGQDASEYGFVRSKSGKVIAKERERGRHVRIR
jgi:hypothetical protein